PIARDLEDSATDGYAHSDADLLRCGSDSCRLPRFTIAEFGKNERVVGGEEQRAQEARGQEHGKNRTMRRGRREKRVGGDQEASGESGEDEGETETGSPQSRRSDE